MGRSVGRPLPRPAGPRCLLHPGPQFDSEHMSSALATRTDQQHIVVMLKVEDKSSSTRKPAEKPISLHPLKFEEAVADLLKVKRLPRERRGTDRPTAGENALKKK